MQRKICDAAIRKTALQYTIALKNLSDIVAQVDCLVSLAYVAWQDDWSRPVMTEMGSKDLVLQGMWHPMLEKRLGGRAKCVLNDLSMSIPCSFDEESAARCQYSESSQSCNFKGSCDLQLLDMAPTGPLSSEPRGHVCLLTGPNMGGKSTYMRTVAVCVLLAHIGSWVPAGCVEGESKEAVASFSKNGALMRKEEAGSMIRIPVVDGLFMRMGATDSQQRHISTFMNEMLEMSHILNRASSNSLVLIDELGQGTSTHDGYGVAWSIVQTLALQNKAMVVCATHLHELSEMANSFPGIVFNSHAAALVSQETGQVTLLRKIMPGPSHHSYGIAVARVANIPVEIVTDAQAIEDIFCRNNVKGSTIDVTGNIQY
jgi:DNA mismatch repair ATPase MutS